MNDNSSRSQPHPSLARTGLERDCLRQAVHDVRNHLNTAALLVDAAIVASTIGAAPLPDASAAKLTMAVRELHRCGRLLDHLTATSDSFASEVAPVDLAAALLAATGTGSTKGVTSHRDLADEPALVLSCNTRLPRLLTMIHDRCVAALPDGGEMRFAVEPVPPDHVRLLLTAEGPRVVTLPRGRELALTDGSAPAGDWFAIKALSRGVGGDVRITQDERGRIRLELELPRSSPRGERTAPPTH